MSQLPTPVYAPPDLGGFQSGAGAVTGALGSLSGALLDVRGRLLEAERTRRIAGFQNAMIEREGAALEEIGKAEPLLGEEILGRYFEELGASIDPSIRDEAELMLARRREILGVQVRREAAIRTGQLALTEYGAVVPEHERRAALGTPAEQVEADADIDRLIAGLVAGGVLSPDQARAERLRADEAIRKHAIDANRANLNAAIEGAIPLVVGAARDEDRAEIRADILGEIDAAVDDGSITAEEAEQQRQRLEAGIISAFDDLAADLERQGQLAFSEGDSGKIARIQDAAITANLPERHAVPLVRELESMRRRLDLAATGGKRVMAAILGGDGPMPQDDESRNAGYRLARQNGASLRQIGGAFAGRGENVPPAMAADITGLIGWGPQANLAQAADVLSEIGRRDPRQAERLALDGESEDLGRALLETTKDLPPGHPRRDEIVRILAAPESRVAMERARRDLSGGIVNGERVEPSVIVGDVLDVNAPDVAAFRAFESEYLLAYAELRSRVGMTDPDATSDAASKIARQAVEGRMQRVDAGGDVGDVMVPGTLGLGTVAHPNDRRLDQFESALGRFENEIGGGAVRPDLAIYPVELRGRAVIPALQGGRIVGLMEWNPATGVHSFMDRTDPAFQERRNQVARLMDEPDFDELGRFRWRPEYGVRSVEAHDAKYGTDMMSVLIDRGVEEYAKANGVPPTLRTPEGREDFKRFLVDVVVRRRLGWLDYAEPVEQEP